MLPVVQPSRRVILPALFLALVASIPLLAADVRARELAGNTLLLAGMVALASGLLGAPLAFLLVRTNVGLRTPALMALVALLFTPLYLQAAAWQSAFGLQGWYTAFFSAPPPFEGWRGAIAIHTLAAIPWIVAIVGIGLGLAEPELEEEALLDASPARVFYRVTLRRASAAMAVAMLWVAVSTAGEMTITDLFGVRTYAEQLYTEFALGDTLGSAPWNLLPSVLSAAWIIAAGLLLTQRLTSADRFATERRARPFELGRWRPLCSLALLAAMLLLVGIPLVSLLGKAGIIVTREGSGLTRSWSAAQAAHLVARSPARFSAEFAYSTAAATLAASLSVVAGLALAWNARHGGWRAAPAWLIVALCLAVPGPLVGLGLIAVFNQPAWPWLVNLYDRSLVVLVLAQAIRALPLGTLILWYALRGISSDLLANAALEGASPLARFFKIALPQRWPAVATAWLVSFVIAWGELAASILVVPPGVKTLPITIFGLIHYGVDDQVAAIALVTWLACFVLAGIAALLVRRAMAAR